MTIYTTQTPTALTVYPPPPASPTPEPLEDTDASPTTPGYTDLGIRLDTTTH